VRRKKIHTKNLQKINQKNFYNAQGKSPAQGKKGDESNGRKVVTYQNSSDQNSNTHVV